MRDFFLPVLILVITLTGCSTSANLYPVEGPLSKISPLPILIAKVEGILGNSGNISMSTADGESFTGKWSVISPMTSVFSSGSVNANTTTGLASVWTSVYGSGYSVANVGGVNSGQGMLIGNMGTVIEIEFRVGSGTSSGTGVAKDNKGNIFRVLF